MVGTSPSFVCHGQYWLVYLTVLSVIGNIDWYINRFCLPCTIMFVYHLVLSVMDNSGWYIALICLSNTISVGISPCLFCHEQKLIVYLPVLSAVDNISL